MPFHGCPPRALSKVKFVQKVGDPLGSQLLLRALGLSTTLLNALSKALGSRPTSRMPSRQSVRGAPRRSASVLAWPSTYQPFLAYFANLVLQFCPFLGR